MSIVRAFYKSGRNGQPTCVLRSEGPIEGLQGVKDLFNAARDDIKDAGHSHHGNRTIVYYGGELRGCWGVEMPADKCDPDKYDDQDSRIPPAIFTTGSSFFGNMLGQATNKAKRAGEGRKVGMQNVRLTFWPQKGSFSAEVIFE